jgi:hypothetical protein
LVARLRLQGIPPLLNICTILILLIFGGLAVSQIPQVDAQVPTPWLGFTVRLNIYAYLLCLAVLAVVLFPPRHPSTTYHSTGPLDV